jgi:nicotinamide-nucleotide amidase
MRCDLLAIGTELILGQIVDTNSSWIGEQLAAAGIDSYEHRQVGDNLPRMVDALRSLLEHADAVIVCGGLGPTQDDVTREAIAEVMGVELERLAELEEWLRNMFGGRDRPMPANNLRQTEVPVGGGWIPNPVGTAPGLLCEIPGTGTPSHRKIVYAVPGVPYEMKEMIAASVIPDLLARSGEQSIIVSRSLKTWGTSESGLSEMIAGRVDAQTNPSIAFLARGIEGLVVRLTAKAETRAEAEELIASEELEVRSILGDLVFGVDDETMESVVLDQCARLGYTLGVAESLTGGLIGARLASVPGASKTFRGTIGAYATDVKHSVLGVTAEHAVSAECAAQMAQGARRVLGADVGVAVTGVAGPDEQEHQPVGTVWFGLAMGDDETETFTTRLPGDRERIRQFSTISVLSALRQRLAAR